MQHATTSQDFFAATLPAICSDDEVHQAIKLCEGEINNLPLRKFEKRSEVLMGLVMTNLRGRIDGAVVAERVGFKKG
jgi:Glu-tRNA(Gln) amidotransferase subunit E-like FAD-binding protein